MSLPTMSTKFAAYSWISTKELVVGQREEVMDRLASLSTVYDWLPLAEVNESGFGITGLCGISSVDVWIGLEDALSRNSLLNGHVDYVVDQFSLSDLLQYQQQMCVILYSNLLMFHTAWKTSNIRFPYLYKSVQERVCLRLVVSEIFTRARGSSLEHYLWYLFNLNVESPQVIKYSC